MAPPPDIAAEAEALRAALARCTAERDAARAEMEDFFRAASHDLRAPLRHLGAFGGLLRERVRDLGGDAEALEYLGAMDDAVGQLGRMVDGLLELSRVGRAPLLLQPVDLGALVTEARSALEPACAGRTIRWELGPFAPCTGDVALLRDLLGRLLSNAVKFTRQTPQAVIAVRAEPAGDRVQLQVRDNGAGFNPAQAGRLFGIFERLHSVSAFEGTGIGLAVVRRIAERHGGCVAADGAPQAGCTVHVTLPA